MLYFDEVMKMANKNVPKATLQRYPVYLKALRKLQNSGIDRVMSKELASVVNPTSQYYLRRMLLINGDFQFIQQLIQSRFLK